MKGDGGEGKREDGAKGAPWTLYRSDNLGYLNSGNNNSRFVSRFQFFNMYIGKRGREILGITVNNYVLFNKEIITYQTEN